ncbi:MAG: endolytic transglycosylase MltG [Tissierellia bacterium]|nr:endolytic transglycosylase MltG [Tissierellia bacterium]
MRRITEWIKDFLYDSIDYIIMIGIIGAVAIIIGWRLDLLFAKEAAELPPSDEIVVESPRDNRDDYVNPEEDDNLDLANSDDNIDNNDENIDENDQVIDENIDENQGQAVEITVVIPPGSLPSKIASILEEHKLISSRAEFVQKTQEMKLDTKLKSGTFKIMSNSSLEEIIRIITK